MLMSVDGDRIKIAIADVLYFRAEAKYIFAVLKGRTLKFESSLAALESAFGSEMWRVHRKYLVRGSAVAGLIKIDGELFLDVEGAIEPIPVSRREASKVRELFEG